MRKNSEEEEQEYTSCRKYQDVYDKLAKKRKIILSEEIDRNIATAIVGMLFLFDVEDDATPIELYINSPGGEVEQFFAIYDAMNSVRAPVATYCVGEASSAAAILLASGHKGMRYAAPNAHIMIHQIQIYGGVDGSGTTIENEAKAIKKMKRHLTEIIAKHTGQTYRKVNRDCEIDKYMTAQESLEYGIIDHIMPIQKEIPELKKSSRGRRSKKLPAKNNEA